MVRYSLIVSLLLSVVMIAGCEEDKKPKKKPTAVTPVAQKQQAPAPPVEKKEPPVEKKEPPVEKKEPPVEKKEPPVEKKEPPVEKKEPPVAPDADKAAKEAQGLLDKIIAMIKDGKLDEAESAMKGLMDKKDSLPEPMQKQIEAAQKSLTAAKALKALPGTGKTPELPKVPIDKSKIPGLPKVPEKVPDGTPKLPDLPKVPE